MHPSLPDRDNMWGPDDVLHEGGLHLRSRGSDGHEAPRIHAARPAPNQDLRFLLRLAPRRNRVTPLHGLIRQGP